MKHIFHFDFWLRTLNGWGLHGAPSGGPGEGPGEGPGVGPGEGSGPPVPPPSETKIQSMNAQQIVDKVRQNETISLKIYFKDNIFHNIPQITLASSACVQSCCPQSECPQSLRYSSLPVHSTESNQMVPVPSPKWASGIAMPPSNPSWLQTTRASLSPHRSSHTVPHSCSTG